MRRHSTQFIFTTPTTVIKSFEVNSDSIGIESNRIDLDLDRISQAFRIGLGLLNHFLSFGRKV